LASYTVIGGSSSQGLAKKIARRLKADYIQTESRVFPDGEQKITLAADPKKGTVVVVQSTSPPVDSNLIEALSLTHKAAEYGSRVFAVIPYMGYARQDREFLPGEVVTMRAVAKLLKSAGASRIFLVDAHSKAALRHLGRAGRNVSAIPDLARHLKKMRPKNPLVVSPDEGGGERAAEFAGHLGSGVIVLEKSRDRRTGGVAVSFSDPGRVRGHDLVLVDDMISTGGSMVKAVRLLKRHGCGRVFVACTHALLIDGAEEKIRGAGVDEIISANTVPGATSVVDVSGTIAEAIMGA